MDNKTWKEISAEKLDGETLITVVKYTAITFVVVLLSSLAMSLLYVSLSNNQGKITMSLGLSKLIIEKSNPSPPVLSPLKLATRDWAEPPKMKPESAACSQGDRTSITEGPCLTSGSSSEISSATKVRRNTSSSLMVVEKNRRKLGSNHIRRRAEAILRLLSRGGCASEERIKKFLGDSPHTSKALQMLLKFDKVKQTGVGGRADHFIYIVGKGARSKAMYRSTMDRKPEPPTIEPKNEACPQGERTTSTTEGPCLTSGGSSEISSARKVRGNSSFSSVVVEQKIRRRFGSNHIRLRKEAILRLLSLGGCALEVRIRQFLGDSPDTSEALRMLLKLEEVKLSGAGGRADPFVYAIAASDKRSMTA